MHTPYRVVLAAVLTIGAVLVGGADVLGRDRDFDAVFADSTIRLDYIFGGTKDEPAVALAHTLKSPGWAGRRSRMDMLPLEGNGQVTLTDAVAGDTLYRTSFSTLYSEWLTLGDSVARAFENTFLVPMPHGPADVTVTLTDARRREIARHSHRLDPKDILIRERRPAGYDTVMVHRGAYDGKRIHVAILPEGFTAVEMDSFVTAARRAVSALFAHEPFGSLSDRFDITAVLVPSNDTGVSVPNDGKWLDTAFGSHFSTFYSDRYLTTPEVFAVHDALTGMPYEHIIILSNTDVYGGGGIYNSYTLTAAGNPRFEPVVVHEFGHSFGGLADEYFYDNDVMTDTYPTDVEPWEPNITTLTDFGTKWQKLLAPGTPVPTPVEDAGRYDVGVYEGGGYSARGIYRPDDNCRMRINDIDHFCAACHAALAALIHFYTD